MKRSWDELKAYFVVDSGGKKTIHLKRTAIAGASLFLTATLLSALLSAPEDASFFIQDSAPEKSAEEPLENKPIKDGQVQELLNFGSKQLFDEKRLAEAKKQSSVSIKYFAPQIIGLNPKTPRSIKSGAKLIGFLLNAIDTREPSPVRVVIPRGGTSPSGVEIEKGSVLRGQFNYRGEDDKVRIDFSILDTPDGESIKLAAQALDTADYTAGVRGEVYSDNGLKFAATLGLSMASGITDTLTEREAIGFASPPQAKSNMKNALYQGISRVAQEQSNKTSEEINGAKSYVIVPAGKEVIINLTEDFSK